MTVSFIGGGKRSTRRKPQTCRNKKLKCDYFAILAIYYCIASFGNKLGIPKHCVYNDGNGVQRHFQQYFSYIMAVRCISGRNRSTRRVPAACRKSLTNFIRVHLAMSVCIMKKKNVDSKFKRR